MKITFLEKNPDEEDEIIIKSQTPDYELLKYLNNYKKDTEKMSFYKDSKIVILETNDIFYFESVDNNVFAYTNENVYESKNKLYQLEENLDSRTFFRANKSVILNLNKIESLIPAFGGRFEAILKNNYKIIISRMYVKILKERLGL